MKLLVSLKNDILSRKMERFMLHLMKEYRKIGEEDKVSN